MRKPRQNLSSEYIHVTQRGLGKRIIFEDDQDRRKYLAILENKLRDYEITVLAWTLMNNHVHLLMRTLPHDLSKLMQRIGTSYSQYFNGYHGHVGKVFQNRFHAEETNSDAHLMAAIRYIHRNCEVAKIGNKSAYRWSSYRDICGEFPIEGAGICDKEAVVDLFGGMEAFVSFHDRETEQDEFIRLDGYRKRISDDDARTIATKEFGADFADAISTMPKSERDKALKLLKELGISVRQLQRLTGIGRGPISKA